MRERELRWIDENWPLWRDLRGIYMYEDDELEEGSEDENEEEGEGDEGEGEAAAEAVEAAVEEEGRGAGDQLEDDGSSGRERDGKMTRRHVTWLFGKRPYVH
jgi:hypothetical protein